MSRKKPESSDTIEYERIRRQFAEDLQSVMAEQKLSTSQVAKHLLVTKKALRKMLWEKDLSFSEMVAIITALGGEFRPYIIIAGWPLNAQKKRDPQEKGVFELCAQKLNSIQAETFKVMHPELPGSNPSTNPV